MTRLRLLLPLILLVAVSACTKPRVWASDEAVARAAYVDDSPPSITLVTVINTRSGAGGHTALVINAEQRVVFDPAGTFKYKDAPERNDFVYGMNPAILSAYYSYHARKKWYVVKQKIEVSPEVAERAYLLAKDHGAVPDGLCANSVTGILKQLPGFESISTTLSPIKAMKEFATLPGVQTDKLYEND